MDVKNAIEGRRSIRRFEDTYIIHEQVLELLAAAQHAPSWCNFQVPYFVVVRDKEVIKRLVTECYPENPATKGSLSSNLIIVACYEKGKSGEYKGINYDEIGTWSMFDLGLACQNMMLRAHEMGIGSVVVGAYDIPKAKQIIELDEKYEIGAIIPMGVKGDREQSMPKRRELDSIFKVIR